MISILFISPCDINCQMKIADILSISDKKQKKLESLFK